MCAWFRIEFSKYSLFHIDISLLIFRLFLCAILNINNLFYFGIQRVELVHEVLEHAMNKELSTSWIHHEQRVQCFLNTQRRKSSVLLEHVTSNVVRPGKSWNKKEFSEAETSLQAISSLTTSYTTLAWSNIWIFFVLFEQLMVMAVVDKCFHTYLAFPFDLLTAPLPPTKCLTKNHILFYNYISVFEWKINATYSSLYIM